MTQPWFRDRHFYTSLALFAACTLIYYFGELINFFGWETLRWEVWYTVHDPHRMLFLAPILYCTYYYSFSGAFLSNLTSMLIFVPRALLISPFPDPTLRMLIFIAVSTALSILMALILIDRDKQAKLPDQVLPVTKKYQATPRSLILVFAFMVAGIVAAGFFFYSNYAANYRTQVEQQISAIADLKVAEIVNYRNERLGDAATLFRNDSFSSLVRRVLANPADDAAQADLIAWMGTYRDNYRYDQIYLLDTRGDKRVTVPGLATPVSSVISQHAAETLQSGGVYFQDFYRDEYDEKIKLALLVPVYDMQDIDRALGVLVLQMDPDTYLYPLINSWPTPSMTAETLIVRREGDNVLYLNELRFLKDTALKMSIPLRQLDVPAVKAVLDQEGIVEGNDYRGKAVIAALRHIPGSPWYMIARMDTSELYTTLIQMLWMAIAIIGALLIASAAGVGLIWRQQTMRDYQARALITDALRESEEKYRLILENSGDMIFTLNEKGEFAYLSPAFQRNMGYELSQMLGHRFHPLIHPDDQQVVESALMAHIKEGKITPGLEYRVKQASGAWRWHTTSGNRILDDSGSFLHYVGIARDITDRKLAMDSLQKLSARQEAILAAVPDIIAEVDNNKVYTWANRSALDFFGQDMIGKEASFYFEGEQDIYDIVQPLFKGGENVIYVESWQRRQDGEKRLLGWWCRVLKDQSGNVLGALSSAQDVTEVKLAEKEILRINAELEQRVLERTSQLSAANRELESFAYSVSHDLRAPLRGIDGWSLALLEDCKDKLNEKEKEYLGLVRSETQQMGRLIDDLLTFSRQSSSEMNRQTLDMTAMAREIISRLLQQNPSINADFIIQPGLTASGDAGLINIALTNLLDNAVKFSSKNAHACIELGRVEQDRRNPFFVRDNGVGFDMAYAHKLFGVFRRLHKSTEFPGTGIGLASVQRIINRHGGRIWAEAKVNEGATFYFTLKEAI